MKPNKIESFRRKYAKVVKNPDAYIGITVDASELTGYAPVDRALTRAAVEAFRGERHAFECLIAQAMAEHKARVQRDRAAMRGGK